MFDNFYGEINGHNIYDCDDDTELDFLDLPRSTTCRYHGKQNLLWIKTDSGWRLREAINEIHKCLKFLKNS